jgi:hypothetical protein
MDEHALRVQAQKFKTAKLNLLLVIVFSSINLLLMFIEADLNFLFSASAPQLFYGIGFNITLETDDSMFATIGLVFAVAALLPYFVCWYFANRKRMLMVVALVFFSFDCLLLFVLLALIGFDISFLLELAFHVWVMICLISGVRAWNKLRGVSDDDFKLLLASGTAQQQIGTVVDSEDDIVYTESMPLRTDDNKGRILIEATHEFMHIVIKTRASLTTMIVDGQVYAEKKGLIDHDYTLHAHVNGKVIMGSFNNASMCMMLYVDKVLIMKKKRFF